LIFFLQIVTGGFAAWNDGDQPDHLTPHLVRNDVDILLDNDKKEFLARIARLIRMI